MKISLYSSGVERVGRRRLGSSLETNTSRLQTVYRKKGRKTERIALVCSRARNSADWHCPDFDTPNRGIVYPDPEDDQPPKQMEPTEIKACDFVLKNVKKDIQRLPDC